MQSNFSLKGLSLTTAIPQTNTNNPSINPAKAEVIKTNKEDEKKGNAEDTMITPFKLKPR